jgi:hypothetical protein
MSLKVYLNALIAELQNDIVIQNREAPVFTVSLPRYKIQVIKVQGDKICIFPCDERRSQFTRS